MDAGQKNLVLNASSLNNFHYTGEIETRRFLCIVLFLHIHITLHTWLEWFQFWSVFLIIFVVVVSCCVHSLTWHARAYNLVVRKWKKKYEKNPITIQFIVQSSTFPPLHTHSTKINASENLFPASWWTWFLCTFSLSWLCFDFVFLSGKPHSLLHSFFSFLKWSIHQIVWHRSDYSHWGKKRKLKVYEKNFCEIIRNKWYFEWHQSWWKTNISFECQWRVRSLAAHELIIFYPN